jgi:hypothetical protein
VPFDSPSSVRFLGTGIVVPNQSYVAGDPTHWAVLDVEVGETGLAEYIPPTAGAAAHAQVSSPQVLAASTAGGGDVTEPTATATPTLPNTAGSLSASSAASLVAAVVLTLAFLLIPASTRRHCHVVRRVRR